MRIRQRLCAILSGWGSIGLIYLMGSLTPLEPTLIPVTIIDRMIPYYEGAIYGYVSFYFFVLGTFFLIPANRLRWLVRVMQITAVMVGVIFFWLPTMVELPQSSSQSPWLLTLVQQIDTPLNCFPSLHITLTILCVWALQVHRWSIVRLGSIVWSLWIIFSVLQLKRHLWWDVLGGLVVAGMLIAWCARQGVRNLEPITKRVF